MRVVSDASPLTTVPPFAVEELSSVFSRNSLDASALMEIFRHLGSPKICKQPAYSDRMNWATIKG
jgi:hypothetical protein